jgi:hypothetical protein
MLMLLWQRIKLDQQRCFTSNEPFGLACEIRVSVPFPPFWLCSHFKPCICGSQTFCYAGRQVAAGAAAAGSDTAWKAWTDALPQWKSSTLNLPAANTADRK